MMVARANEGFGSCTNHGECEAVCPKGIPLEFIGKMNRDLIRALWHRHREPLVIPSVVQEPFHEHAGPDAEESLKLGASEKRSDQLHVNGYTLANGGAIRDVEQEAAQVKVMKL
jgi:succinate dehydrogenase iron-sulfur subunit